MRTEERIKLKPLQVAKIMPLEIQLSILTLQLELLSDEQVALKYSSLHDVFEGEVHGLKTLADPEQWMMLSSIQAVQLLFTLADEYLEESDRFSSAPMDASALYTLALQLIEQSETPGLQHQIEIWHQQCCNRIQALTLNATSKELDRAIKDGFTQRGTIQEEAFTTAFVMLQKALLHAQAACQISHSWRVIQAGLPAQSQSCLTSVTIELNSQNFVMIDDRIAHLLATQAAMNVMLDRTAAAISDFNLCLNHYEQNDAFELKADVLDRMADAQAKIGQPKLALESYQASIKSFNQALELLECLPNREQCLGQEKLEEQVRILERIADIWTKISQPKDAQLYYERCLLSYQLLRDEVGILRIKNKLNRLSQWSFDLPS